MIRRREASKELPLCIRVEDGSRALFSMTTCTVDEHVHSLVCQRFTAKVHHHRDFPFDFVPFRDQEPFQRAGVDVLAKPEAEFLVDFEKSESMIDAVMSPSSRGLVGAHAAISKQAAEGRVIVFVPLGSLPLPSRFGRPFISVSSGCARLGHPSTAVSAAFPACRVSRNSQPKDADARSAKSLPVTDRERSSHDTRARPPDLTAANCHSAEA